MPEACSPHSMRTEKTRSIAVDRAVDSDRWRPGAGHGAAGGRFFLAIAASFSPSSVLLFLPGGKRSVPSFSLPLRGTLVPRRDLLRELPREEQVLGNFLLSYLNFSEGCSPDPADKGVQAMGGIAPPPARRDQPCHAAREAQEPFCWHWSWERTPRTPRRCASTTAAPAAASARSSTLSTRQRTATRS